MKDRIIPLVMKILLGSTLVLGATSLVLFAILRSDSRVDTARKELAELQRTLESYRSVKGKYPAAIQDLFATPPGGGKPALDPARSRDPWGNLYRYAPDGKVWSMGPDGWDHTADDVYP